MNTLYKLFICLTIGIFSCSDTSTNNTTISSDSVSTTQEPTLQNESRSPTRRSEPVLTYQKPPQNQPKQNQTGGKIKAKLDRKALSELTSSKDEFTYTSVFEYYRHRKFESDYDVWTEKLFGRCCTEADLNYSETLYFNITSDIENPKYPVKQLTDNWFTKAYAFKTDQQPKIDIRIELNDSHFRKTSNLKSHNDLLKSEDTIAYPFDFSLVNGYVKTVELFKDNARVKELKVYHNGVPKGIVELMDSPEIQRFSLNLAFLKNDVITLQPISYYEGLNYDDVCISELQSCVCGSGFKGLNRRYSAYKDEK